MKKIRVGQTVYVLTSNFCHDPYVEIKYIVSKARVVNKEPAKAGEVMFDDSGTVALVDINRIINQGYGLYEAYNIRLKAIGHSRRKIQATANYLNNHF